MAAIDSTENPLERWPFVPAPDADGDALVGALERAWALFFLPGDLFIYALLTYAAPVARWLALDAADYGGAVSALLSAIVWFFGCVTASIAYHYVRDLDYRLSAATRRAVATAVVRARIRYALLRQRWRARAAARRPPEPVEEAREVELSAPELRALQVLAGLAAGYALSIGEVAQALRARVYDTQKLLSGLNDLGLLHRALGGIDDEISYTLSAAGKALLAARASRRRAPSPTHG